MRDAKVKFYTHTEIKLLKYDIMILTCSLQGAPLQLALSHVTLALKRPFAISHIK